MNDTTTVLAGTRIRGDVCAQHSVVVEGRLEGGVRTDHELTVAESGVLRGDVHARSVRVLGVVVGSITALERVIVAATGRVVGEITAPAVHIDDAAAFRGSVRDGSELGTIAFERAPVLLHASPRSSRPAPCRPPSSIMPMVGRSQGRMRSYG